VHSAAEFADHGHGLRRRARRVSCQCEALHPGPA
jgi:hypothetical protein